MARRIDTSAPGGFKLKTLWNKVADMHKDGDVKGMPNLMAREDFETAKLKNRVNNIWLWYGRPNWDPLFELIVRSVPGKRGRDSPIQIGCCFCGMTVIGKQLKTACKKFSSQSKGVFFHLHKENF